MRRYDWLEVIAGQLNDEDLVITNLANTATEWHKVRPHDGNLYCVGMGMVSPYAVGLALALPHRKVIALDGDGGILFDLSVLGTIAQTAPANLCVVVFDNGGYVSTGQLPDVASLSAETVSIEAMARGSGIEKVWTVETAEGLVGAFEASRSNEAGPVLIVAKTDTRQAFVGASLPDMKENKYRFARHIEQTEHIVLLRPSAKEHGAPPNPDPPSTPADEHDDLAEVIHDGLRENDVDFVIGLPSSGLVAAQQKCLHDPSMRYVQVAHEGTGIGLCAGAWLGGKRPAALVENFGIFAAGYHLLRGNQLFGIPTLLVGEYRGDAGDQEIFSEPGEVTEPFLASMRINYRVIRELRFLKPAIRDGLRWMNFALRPYAVVVSYDLARHRA